VVHYQRVFRGFHRGTRPDGQAGGRRGDRVGHPGARGGASRAARVVAIDINPNAALSAAENARGNGFGERVVALCSNLLSALAPEPLFDVILSSPPSFPGEPLDLSDRAWHAGPEYRDILLLFEQARERLAPDGRFFVLLSSDSDLALLFALAKRAGFTSRLAEKRSILFESFLIYELRAG
jgi:methylase of polypeptide subunit release factors